MRILLVQTSFLGDVILSTPVIAGIKQRYPECELWMLTTPAAAPLVRRDPMLTGVLELDKHGADRGPLGMVRQSRKLRGMKFDRVYCLHRSYRTALLLWLSGIHPRIGFTDARLGWIYDERRERPRAEHDVIRNLSILHGDVPFEKLDTSLRLAVPPADELSPAAASVLALGTRPVVLVPGSAWPSKCWHVEGYRAVARHFVEKGLPVVLLGSGTEAEVCAEVSRDLAVTDLAGRTSLSDLVALIDRAALLVCNDSMALHVASARKRPCVAIFRATSPAFGFGPWQNEAVVLQGEGAGGPPSDPRAYRRSPVQDGIVEVDALRVIEAAERLLYGERCEKQASPSQ